MIELKKCPFCGSEPYIAFWNGGYYVNCECGVSMHDGLLSYFDTPEEAINAWNRRVKDAD